MDSTKPLIANRPSGPQLLLEAFRRRGRYLLAVLIVLCVYMGLTQRIIVLRPFEYAHDAPFPRHIWQAILGTDIGPEQFANETATWITNNPTWEYHLLSQQTASEIVEAHFSDRPAIIRFWQDLAPGVLRADFIRYLVLLAIGGVYGDIDTSNHKPMDDWIPKSLRHHTINAIVGIEYDDTTYAKAFVRDVGLCQWTIMAKPAHPILETAVARVMSNMDFIARLRNEELSTLKADKSQVLQGTGPGMFTDVVLEVLRNQAGGHLDLNMFHDVKAPMVVGDILILPINGFAAGQKHSHSSDPEYGEIFVRHHFGKSWYGVKPSQ